MAQDVACYLPNCLAASICRRTASSELHAAGAYRHGERQEVQRQGGHGRRLAFNLHVNGSPHLAGETYHAFAFRRCMHARLIHRSTELIDESGDISKSGLREALNTASSANLISMDQSNQHECQHGEIGSIFKFFKIQGIPVLG